MDIYCIIVIVQEMFKVSTIIQGKIIFKFTSSMIIDISFNMIRIDIKSILMVLIFLILPHKLSFSTAEKGTVG